jgi:hypothetical protein
VKGWLEQSKRRLSSKATTTAAEKGNRILRWSGGNANRQPGRSAGTVCISGVHGTCIEHGRHSTANRRGRNCNLRLQQAIAFLRRPSVFFRVADLSACAPPLRQFVSMHQFCRDSFGDWLELERGSQFQRGSLEFQDM